VLLRSARTASTSLASGPGYGGKYRVNLEQEFVIEGYVPSNLGVDSLVVGFYRGQDLVYAARVRAGLVPATRCAQRRQRSFEGWLGKRDTGGNLRRYIPTPS
jgi:hypothetical protein